jgi:prephenate dehydratase
MATATKLAVGTLGGRGTMADQAAQVIRARYPDRLGDVSYFPSVDDVQAALTEGKVDVIVLSEQITQIGFSGADDALAAPESDQYILAEAAVPYGCALLVKPGTKLEDIREVLGHGSIRMCRRWLAENLPNAEIAGPHELNSLAAAKEVAAGDGTLAVVSTLTTGEMTGLVPLARDIDDGAVGNWWAFSRAPHFADHPNRLLVSGRLRADGKLGRLAGALAQAGYDLTATFSKPTGKAIFEYDYLLWFRGKGDLAAVQSALKGFDTTRLIGAYEAPEGS